MKFGPVPVAEAVGALSVHAVRAGGVSVRKGMAVTPEQAAGLRSAGIESITAARLEPGDVGENDAAERLAASLAGPGVTVAAPFTGRANLFAAGPGLLTLDREAIEAVNRVDEALTVATLPHLRPVAAGEMVATVKVIPYAVPADTVLAAVARAGGGAIAVSPYRVRRVAAVSTLLPGLKASVVRRTVAVLEDRLRPAGAAVVSHATCPHRVDALAEALRDTTGSDTAAELIVVFGASAIADRRDVIPAALEAAGGRIEHFGMPVDPGNLMLVGALGDRPVIGAPGCARSPKENGFDWVLNRLLAGIPVSRHDIVAMGVGGLLVETRVRGQPRDADGSEDA